MKLLRWLSILEYVLKTIVMAMSSSKRKSVRAASKGPGIALDVIESIRLREER